MCVCVSIHAAPYVRFYNASSEFTREVKVGTEFNFSCKASSRKIYFYIVGSGQSINDDGKVIPPASNPRITKSTAYNDSHGNESFYRTLRLHVIPELNNIALECGAKERVLLYGRRTSLQVYSRAFLLRGQLHLVSCPRPQYARSRIEGLSPLFWSGRDFGPRDQHPQESALVIMVRVGDCGGARD